MNDESVALKASYTSASSSNVFLQADLGSARPVSRIRIGGNSKCGSNASNVSGPVEWTGNTEVLQYSDDGSTWTTVTNLPAYSGTAMTDYTFTSVTARYWRLHEGASIPGNGASLSRLSTGQFRLGN
jgi:hypothetical protein